MKIMSKVMPGCFDRSAGRPAAVSHSRQSSLLALLVCSTRGRLQVLRASQRLVAVEQRRAADRKHFLGHQPVGAQARPLAAAIADRDIDIVALEIDQAGRGGDPHVDAGMGFLERGKPRQQPFCGERRQRGDGQPWPSSLRSSRSVAAGDR